MIFAMLVFAAQVSASSAASLPPSPATEPAGEVPRHNMRRQVFIAPSGEPFRAPIDAPYPVVDWFQRADSNHDGKLTEAEFTADFLRFAVTLDTNHDGIIDSAELEIYETTIAPEVHTEDSGGGGGPGGAGGWGGEGGRGGKGEGGAGGRHGGGGHGHGHHGGGGESDNSAGSGGHTRQGDDRPRGAGRYGIITLPEPVAAMATDLNVRISRAEVREAAAYRFSLLDTQQAGFLVLSELPETFAQAHGKAFRQRKENGGKREHREDSD